MMKATVLLCAMAAPAIAAAADDAGHWYVTPQVGGISSDHDRPVADKDWLYGVGIGRNVSDAISVEMNLNGTRLGNRQGPGDLSIYGGLLYLLGVMNRSGRVAPYVSVGLGAARNEPTPGANATDFMAQTGVGLILKLWERADGARSFSLRPDFKVRWDDAGAPGRYRDYIGTLGFQYSFGAPTARPVLASLPPPPPPPEPQAAPPPPPPAPPLDSDHDGVTDDIDKCPGTPAGVAVDASGCPRQGAITLEGVAFEVHSARLPGESR